MRQNDSGVPDWVWNLICADSGLRRLGLDPREVAQELVLALLERAVREGPGGASAGPDDPRFWRWARASLIDVLRKHRRQSERSDPLPAEPLPGPDDVERTVACRRAMRGIRQRLDGWDAAHRQCLDLRWRRGLTQREVAAEIGASPAAVARRTKRCLDELRVLSEAHL